MTTVGARGVIRPEREKRKERRKESRPNTKTRAGPSPFLLGIFVVLLARHGAVLASLAASRFCYLAKAEGTTQGKRENKDETASEDLGSLFSRDIFTT